MYSMDIKTLGLTKIWWLEFSLEYKMLWIITLNWNYEIKMLLIKDSLQFLAGLQNNSSLWIDVSHLPVRLSVCLTSTFWLTFVFKFWNLLCNPAIPSSMVSCCNWINDAIIVNIFNVEKLGHQFQMKKGKPENIPHYISLSLGNVTVMSDSEDSADGYKLLVVPQSKHVEILGNSSSGVFYGVQSLLFLCDTDTVPSVNIVDAPRYPYRGMHMDVSRNFQSKEQIMKLLDVMAMYKLNKFHFHLTDDEGWRLEIPGLEELPQ